LKTDDIKSGGETPRHSVPKGKDRGEVFQRNGLETGQNSKGKLKKLPDLQENRKLEKGGNERPELVYKEYGRAPTPNR